jgi:hypothetical protein
MWFRLQQYDMTFACLRLGAMLDTVRHDDELAG